MSKKNNWIPLDKELVKSLPKDGRPYTKLEAMFSFTYDIDCGKQWTINGYSKLWGWSRCKVRNFINNIRHPSGHTLDTLKTHLRHTVHFIDKGLWTIKDTGKTPFRHPLDTPLDTTNNPNPNPKKNNNIHFNKFWEIYPKKTGKKPCLKKWQLRKLDNISDKIISDVQWRISNDKQWENGFIPNPLTYINQDRWEDEQGKEESDNIPRITKEQLKFGLEKGWYQDGNYILVD